MKRRIPRRVLKRSASLVMTAWFAAMMLPATTFADAWADQVVSYVGGGDAVDGGFPDAGYTNPNVALGHPSITSTFDPMYGSYVLSPFSPASGVNEIVSIGLDGELTVGFDEPVTDDPDNPFGIDLIVFGNSFFTTDNFDPTAVVVGLSSEGGSISVSADGVNFVDVVGLEADGLYPTNAYSDTSVLFPQMAGEVLADYTRPVDPSFDASGLTAAQAVAGYDGSAGGAGVDIGALGLSEISYVRISNATTTSVEIDGFADVSPVPEPASWLILSLTLVPCWLLRRRWR